MNSVSLENLGRTVGVDPIGGGMEQRSARQAQREFTGETGGAPAGGTGGSGTTFASMLTDSLDKVNAYQVQADTAIKELVAGRSKNIHETMLTVERADASLKLMMQVRNKVLDAYREIMRMQV